ncbi:hypothetical protein, variant [Microbotryum lychnidis-dioicae p1A1 Lamole]|uniref:RRM domain-containing protein n=1 Tax=Microbotryum lychnidis-dioicae (strain p1A1 Lamole / MvSl-1064) TaxID=683840 RepID=U5H5T3_USTV1|nr:hypothetical protein, variant [Microbotryum lychnidis-dioicae p1A1 Lamole]|eukprot:KDE07072.1 hypothetical protein, variant [Microbotryum lychnidis-dioicae p1A1 Lamole]
MSDRPTLRHEEGHSNRREEYDDRDRSSRHRRRSESRSPPPARRNRSRSRSPRRSASPPRKMEVDRAVDPPKREFRSSRYNPDRDHGSRATGSTPYDPVRKAAARQTAAIEASKHSKKENRVYITNLSFNVKWNDLKDFMREGQ